MKIRPKSRAGERVLLVELEEHGDGVNVVAHHDDGSLQVIMRINPEGYYLYRIHSQLGIEVDDDNRIRLAGFNINTSGGE